MTKKVRTVAIGIQDFSEIRENDYFYIDKTDFIREWWESGDSVTLIARPRRFGKTLNMSMLEQFFSVKYAFRSDLFEDLSVWADERYRQLQGTFPVISLSFANVKEPSYELTRERIFRLLLNLYSDHEYLLESDALTRVDKIYLNRVINGELNDADATFALHQLTKFLYQYYGKKVIILLDEYDTPMQEAYVKGYWEELAGFTRSLFNSTFKTNPYLERGMMTGITRVSKESIFSDLNNLNVVTTTSDKYASVFGFTEKEVFSALDEYGLSAEKGNVKRWYDGFIFGKEREIYNPWSILNYIETGKYNTYWANTSSNSLVSKLIREGNPDIKMKFEELLKGKHIWCPVDEQTVYNQLNDNEDAIWSLLLASGYLKVLRYEKMEELEIRRAPLYELTLTNHEVEQMFAGMVSGWFYPAKRDYNGFVQAMLVGDVDAMNEFMNRIALQTFSYFDTGSSAIGPDPERFYHGFVLGLLVELEGRYTVKSNRESGFGRYDVLLEPNHPKEDAGIIIEFKVYNRRKEASMEETLKAAMNQIEEKQYAADLMARGIPKENIRAYGFAFEGKKVLIGQSAD